MSERAKTVVLNVRLPADIHEVLVTLAKDEDRSLNGQIVHGLRRYLTEIEDRRRTTPRQMCAEAGSEYRTD